LRRDRGPHGSRWIDLRTLKLAGVNLLDDTHTDEIYGLLETAARQQAILQGNLEHLAAETTALETEREHLTNIIVQLRENIDTGVAQAVERAMAGITDNGNEVVRNIAESLRNVLLGAVTEVGRLESTLRNIIRWMNWRLLSWILAALLAIFLISWAAGCATLWWNAGAIARSEATKRALQEQIALLESDSRVKGSAGLIEKLNSCGNKKRRCIQVDESAGAYGANGDYRVIKGY
jgi:hypothetical protein